jgi:hypothetical protein
VKLDGGRQFFFDGSCGVNEPAKGLRVLARSQQSEDGGSNVELQLPAGGRQFAEVNPKPPPKRRAAATKKRTRTPAIPKPKTGPKRGVVKRVVHRGESLERGISVAHPVHGQGFVVLSTSSMARIRFMPSQEERSVRVVDLEVLEGT